MNRFVESNYAYTGGHNAAWLTRPLGDPLNTFEGPRERPQSWSWSLSSRRLGASESTDKPEDKHGRRVTGMVIHRPQEDHAVLREREPCQATNEPLDAHDAAFVGRRGRSGRVRVQSRPTVRNQLESGFPVP